LILDEPTSALDPETEKNHRPYLRDRCREDVIIITHRPALAEIADQSSISRTEKHGRRWRPPDRSRVRVAVIDSGVNAAHPHILGVPARDIGEQSTRTFTSI